MSLPINEQQKQLDDYKANNPQFAQWLNSLEKYSTENVSTPPTIRDAPVGVDAEGGIDWMQSYFNRNEGNTCGQAAIAALLDFNKLNPWNLQRWNQGHWDDEEVIQRIIGDGFGPNVFFGVFGTNAGQITLALQHYGLYSGFRYSPPFGSGDEQWTDVKNWVVNGHPVATLVDTGALGGNWWGAHWPIVHKVEGGQVWLANWAHGWNSPVPEDAFFNAFHCWFLPYGFNYCYAVCQPQ